MANELLVGVKIGAVVSGAFAAAFASARGTLGQLGRASDELRAKHARLGDVMARALAHPTRNVGELRRQYERLGQTLDQLRAKQEKLAASMARGDALKAARADLRGQALETGGTALALGAPVMQSVRLAANFQDQLRDVAITGEFSKAEEARLGTVVREAALRWNQTQAEIASGMGVLVAGGIQEAKELERYAPIMAKAATATRASMDDLGSVMIALRDNLKITAGESEQAFNMLAYAGKRGQFEIRDMAKWLPTLSPSFQALGVTGKEAVAEIGAALQIARKGAGSNDEAANNFRNFIQKITSPDTLKDFEKAGIDLKASMMTLRAQGLTPVQSMLEIITQYMRSKGPEATGALQKALAIKDDKERETALQRLSEAYKLGELFQDMQAMNFIRPAIANMAEMKDIQQGSMGAADKGLLDADYKKRIDTANEQFKAFRIGLMDIGMTIGDALLPPLTDLLHDVQPLVKSFGDWAKKHPGLIKGTIGLVAGLLAGKMAIIGLRYGVNLVLSPFNAMGTAVQSLSSKWTLLRGLWQAGRFAPLISGLRLAGQAVLWLGRALMLNPIGLAVTAIGVAAYLVWKHWDKVKAALIAGWNWIKGLGQGFYKAGGDLIDGLINGVKSKIAAARASIVEFGMSIKNWFADTLGIKSPSRVFMGFGDNVAQGAAIGISRSSGVASRAAGNMAAQTAAAANAQRTGAGMAAAGGGVSIHFNPVIHVQGGAAEGVKGQVQQAMQMSLHELEQMIKRVIAQQARRSYAGG
ncbi:MAG: phage tail tape measure protein [Pseudomonadota bacterium]